MPRLGSLDPDGFNPSTFRRNPSLPVSLSHRLFRPERGLLGSAGPEEVEGAGLTVGFRSRDLGSVEHVGGWVNEHVGAETRMNRLG